jgi:hypothetical protein
LQRLLDRRHDIRDVSVTSSAGNATWPASVAPTRSQTGPVTECSDARLGYRRSTAKLSRAIDQPRANRPDIANLHVRRRN